MRIPSIANDPSKVQLSRPTHVYVDHPNLDEFAKFAVDFGFTEEARNKEIIYFRGYGKDPYVYVACQSKDGKPRFRGAAFVAASQEEFDKAAQLEGARLGSIQFAPGGGSIITLNRPDETYFYVVFGQREREVGQQEPTATHEKHGPLNKAFEKPWRGKQAILTKRTCAVTEKIYEGMFQRYHPGPALVHKLGHYGYVVPDFDNELAWYTENFKFVPSDIPYHWAFDNLDVMVFFHLDLGEEFSDHHCFFMQRAEPHVRRTFCHHMSFEVADFDIQLLGHDWLAKKGWHSIWGVGRHVLGSQIFDYWADPNGFKIEYYVDDDIVNKHTPTTRSVVGPMSIWCPEIPKDFGGKVD
ncbi:trihydroxytoluene oxygenase [Colletotrichum incanum]|uniref:Trihydroxytoluene oxygenase n=1 Tax=Colletotrichum incanum TaxID=1573173 RepID=A0A167CAI9_COLIC|nr:trihydroxytoluene oxygenase [Colletotrichum incanum]